jgi:phytoene synthase
MRARLPERLGADDLTACARELRAGSKSFNAAARLLPARVRASATALYAFCRDADDLVDHGTDPAASVALLRVRLDAIYAGRPGDCACDRALAVVVERHDLPRAPLDALIEGFEWDALGRRYATLGELEDYCARVAGTVGAMMAVLMGARSPEALARACELGVAMQMTNIARDVGEDARKGRLYLPLEWFAEAGLDPDGFLAAPAACPRVRGIIQRLLDAADVLYARIDRGVAKLAPACRPGIHAARLIYADIGRVVRGNGHDSVTRRAVVPGHRKAWLLAKSYALLALNARAPDHAPLAAIRFLVDAVARPEPLPTETPSRLAARAIFVIELFARLETQERMAAAALANRPRTAN